jgi:hypothetical protein
VKWEVCEKSTFLNLCLAKGAVGVKIIKFGLSVSLNYSYILSPSISPDNREYTAVLAIIFESPEEPSNEKCPGPTNPLIRPCPPLITLNHWVHFHEIDEEVMPLKVTSMPYYFHSVASTISK